MTRLFAYVVAGLACGLGCADGVGEGANTAADVLPASVMQRSAAGTAAPVMTPTRSPTMAGGPGPTSPPATTPAPDTAPPETTEPPPATMETTPQPTTPVGTPTMTTGGDPVIPPVGEACPQFRGGTLTFGGVSGINMAAGAKAPSASAPMVVYWHGTGSFAAEYVGMAGAVHQGVVAEGGVLVSFQGSSGVGDSSCSGTFIFSLGDMDVIDDLVGCAVQDHNVDPKRIYTTGCSAGGLFAACMAARRSSYVAAAAPNSGGFAIPQPFENAYTPALMTVHGAPGRDVVIIDFSNSSATADRMFKDRGGFVINCNHGGGHCGGGGLARDIWEFFKAHPYGVDPHPWASGLPAGFNSSCEIY